MDEAFTRRLGFVIDFPFLKQPCDFVDIER